MPVRKRSSTNNSRAKKTTPVEAQASGEDNREYTWQVIRPLLVLCIAGVVMNLCMYVEAHPTGGNPAGDATQILDTGFVLTVKSHAFLEKNPLINDIAAFANSVLVVAVLTYVLYVTLWIGDFGLAFRLLFSQFFRAYCGWFTYLPPSKEFLQSQYDVPEILTSGAMNAMLRLQFPVTSVTNSSEALSPFVSFFSGHVANVVIVANHMYHNGNKSLGLWAHFFNALQIYRLLATRGHYSIDIIVGWIVAVYVSNPAERVGLYFSTVSREELVKRMLRKRKSPLRWFERLVDADQNSFPQLRRTPEKPVLRKFVEGVAEKANEAIEVNRNNMKDVLDDLQAQHHKNVSVLKEAFKTGSLRDLQISSEGIKLKLQRVTERVR